MFLKSRILVLSALFSGLPSVALAEEVDWQSDYARVRQEAIARNQPILVKVGSTSCGWCHRLDATTFRDPVVVRKLQGRLVALKVDAARDRWLVQALKIDAFPTLIFAAPDGTILKWQEGYVSASELLQQIEQVTIQLAQPASNNGSVEPVTYQPTR